MKLRTKFLSLIVFLVLTGEVLMYGSIRQFAEQLVGDLMIRYGQVISKYDTEKTLAPLFKEIDISKALAADPVLLTWAKDPDNPKLYKAARQVLDKYRWRYLSNKGYYHNNASNTHYDDPYQYTLNPQSKTDEWFFRLVERKEKINVNINPDFHLGVTKVWINVLIEESGEILGKVGTGIDYNELLADLYANSDEMQGVSSVIIDNEQKIKLHRKNGISQKGFSETEYLVSKNLSELIDNPHDLTALQSAMNSVSDSTSVNSIFVKYEGVRQLAVISHIPELDWYEVTFIDMATVLPERKFIPLYMMFGGILLFIVVVIGFMFNRWVTKPLSELEAQTQRLTQSSGSHANIHFGIKTSDELGALMKHFEEMASTIQNSTEELEQKVEERTAVLDRLASIDLLTELFNRRGMENQLSQAVSQAKQTGNSFGILWIDVDFFKEINDSMGHSKGDSALKLIASTINAVTQDSYSASRWGGDEFLVLTKVNCTLELEKLAEQLRGQISKLEISSDDGKRTCNLTVSVGGAIITPDMNLQQALQHADHALYKAKSDGRNSISLWDEHSDD